MLRLLPFLSVLLVFQLLGGSITPLSSADERVRAFTRSVGFDFVSWTLDAAILKLKQAALGVEKYIDQADQSQLVRDYVALVNNIQTNESQIAILHANPDINSVQGQLDLLEEQLATLYERRSQLAPLAENILQAQVASVLKDESLTSAGQPLPPLLFHSTPLPWALIVSPRASISQQANISLETDLTLPDHLVLEDEVAQSMDVSTLVTPVGGVGTYPTMVAQTSALNWLCEVISHEWTHNYLTWHPLGFLYFSSPELTTMNETTANIAGKEIGAAVIARYYPELVLPPVVASSQAATSSPTESTESYIPVFDYRHEMHVTRTHVDALLAQGKVEPAETYMEARRLIFWDHGYAIRKLNQAYFAFYGSYADTPTGPAGADPVGAAVRELRTRSSSLAEFIDLMAALTSFTDLQSLLANLN